MKFKKQIEVMILVIMCSFSAGWYVAAEENEGEEIQKEYEIRIEEPDGENGYYVTAPEMTLWASGREEIFYRMEKADGTEESGKLEKNIGEDKEETKEEGEEPKEPE